MGKVPGKYDGQRFEDLRLIHMSVPMIMWYAKSCQFDLISKVNSGQLTTSVWLSTGVKHSWRSGGFKEPYTVTEFDRYNRKLRSYPVTLPTVPDNLSRRFANPTPEEIYALVARLQGAKEAVVANG